MVTLAHIWRHPLKSHGREALQQVILTAGQTMPWDRRWAVAHEAAKIDGSEWAPCANFSRGSKAPQLMAMTAKLNESTGILTLSHPNLDDIAFDPDGDIAEFLQWVTPLMPQDRAQSAKIIRVEGVGMTDTPYQSISINSLSSLAESEMKIEQSMDQRRWRGNLWLDGLAPWAEFEWIGKTDQIGDAVLDVCDPVTRCLATTANPDTGLRDADTLGTLQSNWGHKDFGVYAKVIQSGQIKLGDKVQVLA